VLAPDVLRAYRDDPVLMVRKLFGVEPDHWQAEALRAFASRDPKKQRIALQACAGPGKSTVLAWCGLNFILCYATKDKHPNGYAISITADNLRDNLWKEFAVWMNRSDLFKREFVWTAEKIFQKDKPRTWWLAARSFPKKANAEELGRTLSGLHAPFILYLIDESGDIPTQVGRTAEQGLSNCEWGKIVTAGNPTSHQGYLHQTVAEQAHLFFAIRITGDPDDPKRSKRISVDHAREQIALYGRLNPWVMAYILGEFPPSSLNSILGVDEVRAAMERGLKKDQYDWSQKRLGIDVARFGDDRTVLQARQGLNARYEPEIMRHQRTTAIAARASMIVEKWGAELITIDDTGHWGHGVVDNLLTTGLAPLAITFSDPALNPRYYNRRTEMWMEMAEWVRRGGCLPNIPELISELTTPTYTFHKGAILLQEKDQIKALIGRSPDLADALALTFAIPDMPSNTSPIAIARSNTRQQTMHEYDPLATTMRTVW
jgi:phage terminase large subunit